MDSGVEEFWFPGFQQVAHFWDNNQELSILIKSAGSERYPSPGRNVEKWSHYSINATQVDLE
jgi:hypothetical protein